MSRTLSVGAWQAMFAADSGDVFLILLKMLKIGNSNRQIHEI